MHKEINVLALVKGEERYIFLYDDERRVETLRMLGRYAADPQLSFTWYDAAVMSKRIREMANSIEEEQAAHSAPRPEKHVPRFSFRPKEDHA
jgi:hypothetical protein